MSDEHIDQIRHALEAERLTINALDDGSGVLLDVEGEQLLTLNATGMRLIRAIADHAASAEELGARMASEYDVTPDRAEADVRMFIDHVARAL